MKTSDQCKDAGTCSRVDKKGSPCQSQDKAPSFGAIHKPDHDHGCHMACNNYKTPAVFPGGKYKGRHKK